MRARTRRRRAVLSLVAALLAAIALDAGLRLAQPGVRGESLGLAAEGALQAVGLVEEDGSGGEGAADGDSGGEGAVGPLPAAFAEEVFDLGGCADVRVGAGGSVVGFTVGEAPEAAFGDVARKMADRGWTAVPSGSGQGGSFVKEGGSLRWAYVACVRVGSETSVVVQVHGA